MAEAPSENKNTGGATTSLENKLHELFVTKAPFQLPAATKETFVKISPWVSLIVGVLGLWGAWGIWRLKDSVERLYDALGTFGDYARVQSDFGALFYLSVITLVVASVLELAAVPGLMNRARNGWRLLFYGALVNVVYSVVYFLADTGSYFGNMVFGLLGSVVGLYFLFQVRSHYK